MIRGVAAAPSSRADQIRLPLGFHHRPGRHVRCNFCGREWHIPEAMRTLSRNARAALREHWFLCAPRAIKRMSMPRRLRHWIPVS